MLERAATRTPLLIALGAAGILVGASLFGDRGAPTPSTTPPERPAPTAAPLPPPSGIAEAWQQWHEQQARPLVAASPPPATTPEPAATGPYPVELFHYGADGQLTLNLQLRAVLEAVVPELQARGELPAFIEALEQQLPAGVAEQAVGLTEGFAHYLAASERDYPVDALVERLQGDDIGALEQLLNELHALRVNHFGAETAAALFGSEERHTRHLIETRRIEQDPNLSAAERARRRQELETELAPAPGETGDPELAAMIAAMRAEGASEAEIQALRARNAGPDAAEQLARMQAQQAEWERRYRAYSRERDLLLQAGLSEADREAELAALRARHFAPGELAAVRMYDRAQQP